MSRKKSAFTCPNCNAKAIITSTKKQSNTTTDKYCACTNVENCGATFVMTQSFAHYLNLPRQSNLQIALNFVKTLSPAEFKRLQADMFAE